MFTGASCPQPVNFGHADTDLKGKSGVWIQFSLQWGEKVQTKEPKEIFHFHL